MGINVTIESEDISVPKYLKTFCKKNIMGILQYLHIDNVAITLVLTGDEAIASINSNYRKKKGPTDVLSFAYREAPTPMADGLPEYLGDVIISLETAQKQAQEYNVPLHDEILRLIVHGMLHLLGYDHEQYYKKKQMQKKEEELLQHLR